MSFEPGETRLFKPDIVVIVQIVQAKHGFAPFEEAKADMHADETGRAGDQNGHEGEFRGSGAIRKDGKRIAADNCSEECPNQSGYDGTDSAAGCSSGRGTESREAAT